MDSTAEKTTENVLDVLAIGEALVDFISEERTDWLGNAATFRRYLGGSPANIAASVCRLGGSSAVVSKTGIGAFGQFVKSELQRHGVRTDYLLMDHRTNTSITLATSTAGRPDSEDFRSGDFLLRPEEISPEAIDQARVVHASAFALSREPCRSAVLRAFVLAREGGKVVSLNPGYSAGIWPNHREAREVLRQAYRYVDVTGPTLYDAGRIFGRGHAPEHYVEMFHELGPCTVVLALEDGVLVSRGDGIARIPALPVEAADVFWAGFLVALLDGHGPERCALFAREVAKEGLSRTAGPLEEEIDRGRIHTLLEQVPRGVEARDPAVR